MKKLQNLTQDCFTCDAIGQILAIGGLKPFSGLR